MKGLTTRQFMLRHHATKDEQLLVVGVAQEQEEGGEQRREAIYPHENERLRHKTVTTGG